MSRIEGCFSSVISFKIKGDQLQNSKLFSYQLAIEDGFNIR